MSIEQSDIEKIALLARIRVNQDAIPEISDRINDILKMVDSMQAVNTDGIEPMANPLDATQRLRVDVVTETNHREAFQAIAPQIEHGLYLVPKVIE